MANYLLRWCLTLNLTYGLSQYDDILMLTPQRPVGANPLTGKCTLLALLPQAVVTLSPWLHLAPPNDHVLRLQTLQYLLQVTLPLSLHLRFLMLPPCGRFFPTQFLFLFVQMTPRRMKIQLLPPILASVLKKNTILRPRQHPLILLPAWAILSGDGHLLMTRNSPV